MRHPRAFQCVKGALAGLPLYVVHCTSRSIQFIFIFMPAAVEAGASVDFATALAPVELCVFTEAITFLGVLAAEGPGGIT